MFLRKLFGVFVVLSCFIFATYSFGDTPNCGYNPCCPHNHWKWQCTYSSGHCGNKPSVQACCSGYGTPIATNTAGTTYDCGSSWTSASLISGTCDDPNEVFDAKLGQCVNPNDEDDCNAGKTKHPIITASGNKVLPEVDYRHKGESDLQISRDYIFTKGVGQWTFNYMQSINFETYGKDKDTAQISIRRSDGTRYYVTGDVVASGTDEEFLPRTDIKYAPYKLYVDFDSSKVPTAYDLLLPNGTIETYNASGQLTTITSRLGLVQTISYSTNAMNVTDERYGVELDYTFDSSSGFVTQIVVSGVGTSRTFTYEYNGSSASNGPDMLKKVTFPYTSPDPAPYVEYFYGDGSTYPLTGLITKKENGTTYLSWEYDASDRADRSYLGASAAEDLNLDYYADANGVIEWVELNNEGKITNYYFNNIGGVNRLAHTEGEASSSCAPSDGYITYEETDTEDHYRQKETVTRGVDTSASDDGSLVTYEYNDTNWPHLVTAKVTGVEWGNATVKPWSTSGTLDPTDYDILAESHRVQTTYHADVGLPTVIKYFAPNSGLTAFETTEYRRIELAYDDGDGTSGTTNCDGNSFDSYRLCSRTEYDVAASKSRTINYSYTYHTSSTDLATMKIENADITDDEVLYTYNEPGTTDGGYLASIERDYDGSSSYALETTFEDYNEYGFPETITDYNGAVSKVLYDERGRVDTTKGDRYGINAVTLYLYNTADRVSKIIWPDGSNTEYFYTDAKHLKGIKRSFGNEYIELTPSDINGQWTTMEVCSTGYSTGCIGSSIVATYKRVFDEAGRVSKLLDESSNPLKLYGYDRRDNVTTNILLGDSSNTPDHDDNDIAKVFTYDKQDRVTEVVGNFDCGGTCSKDSYNNFSGTVPSSPEITYDYNGQGRLSKVTDDNGTETSYTYNGFGEVIEENSEDRGITKYVYNEAGKLVHKTTAYGTADVKKTCYAYDNLLRLTGIDYGYAGSPSDLADCATTSFSADTSFTYDQSDTDHGKGKGRLTNIDDSSGDTDYKYDALGRIIVHTVTPYGTSLNLATKYTYDNGGAVTSLQNFDEDNSDDGRRIDYNRTNGRLTSMDVMMEDDNNPSTGRVESTGVVSIDSVTGYLPFGRIKDFDRYTASSYTINTVRSLDDDGRLSSIYNEFDDGSTQSTQTLSYSYDAFSNIYNIADSDAVTAVSNSAIYEYDAMMRLVEATGSYGKYLYTYDGVGNRLTKELQRAPATDPTNFSQVFKEYYYYNNSSHPNWLTDVTRKASDGTTVLRDRDLTYDSVGNVVTDERTVGASTDTIDLDYGDDNRLDSVDAY